MFRSEPGQRSDRTRQRWIGGGLTGLLFTWALYCVAAAAQAPATTTQEPPPATPESVPVPETPAPGDRDAPGPGAEYVGSAICGAPACHGGMQPEFDTLRHTKFVSDAKYGQAAGCEICHGPAGDHVLDPEHRRIWRFTLQNRQNARRINEACTKCHQETIRRPHFQASEHERVGLSCASCHEVHYDLKNPYLLRHPGVGGPAGRPLPLKQWLEAGDAVAVPPAPMEPGAPPLAPLVTAPMPAAARPGRKLKIARTQEPPMHGREPAPEPETPAEPPPSRPRLERLAKTRVPIPNWKTSYPREPTAVTKEQAINEVCAACHRRQVSEFRMFSHHPLFEARVNCTDCHDRHHARDGRMLRQAGLAQGCLECHENIRGPFVFEHEPVKAGGVGRDCMECHRPHGSPHRKLAVMFSRGLCVQCHTSIQQDPAHQQRPGSCWRAGCHTAVHGSNHSLLLFRE